MSKKTTAKNTDSVWSPVVKIVAVVCTVVLIAAITLAVVAKTGYFRRNTIVMEVGDSKISALEFNYNYYFALNNFYSQNYYYLSYIGFDATTSLKNQSCYYDSSISWYDYFVAQTKMQLEEEYLLYNKAVSEGFEMTQESKDNLDQSIQTLKETAAEEDIKVNEYLASMYGANITLNDYKEFLSRKLLSADFYTAYTDGLEYSDEEIDQYYKDNKSTYDRVYYYAYEVKVEEGSEKSPEEIANEIKNSSTGVDAFIAAIGALENADTFKAETYLKENATYTADDETSEWLFDSARVNGDVTVITEVDSNDTNTYTVICFVERGREDYQLATMRHILFQVEEQTDEEGNVVQDENGESVTNDAEMKAKAEAVLQQWKDGDKTEDSFAALVHDNTDDTSSAETGGLYEDFDQSTMVTAITDWIWLDGRKAGDCEIVETEYGYHIVYFVGYGETKWKSDIVTALKTENYQEYLETLKEEIKITYNEKGFSQVG